MIFFIWVNLNDNIEVYPNRYSTLCGGWMFITNLEDYITAGTVEREVRARHHHR